MPAKPAWYGDLDHIIEQLERHPRPWVDRRTVEVLLNIGPRRAQQILAPCITEQIGSSGVADRELLIRHLRRIGQEGSAVYERQRRNHVAAVLDELRASWTARPRLLVEAPPKVTDQKISGLPDGVKLRPGEIVVQFATATEALEKLLAIAMAAGNEYDRFVTIVEGG